MVVTNNVQWLISGGNSYYEKFADGTTVNIDDEIPFDIPSGWEWVRLRMVADVARGGSPRPIKDYLTESANGVNWIKIGDTEKGGKYINSTKEKIKPEGVSKSRLIHKGDFLLTNSMSFGRPYISNIDGCIHDGWLVISPAPCSYTQDFLFYLLSSRFAYDQFCGKVSGAVVQNLNSDKVADAIIPMPPIAEQNRVVALLDSLLPLVERYRINQEEQNRLNNTILLKLKKSILQEAIRGNLVEQDPKEEPATILLDRIRNEKLKLLKEGKIRKKDIFDSLIFKSEDNKYFEKMGDNLLDINDSIPFDIPNSWTWVRLQEACVYIHRGKSPKYSEIKQYPVIAQKCNQWDGFHLEKAQFITPDSVSSYSKESVLQDKDLLWNSTGLGTLGRIGIYPAASNPYGFAVADSHVTVIRTISYLLRPEFLLLYLSSPTVQNGIEDKASGSTKQKELATDTIKSYYVPIPPITEQDRILEKYKSVIASITRK